MATLNFFNPFLMAVFNKPTFIGWEQNCPPPLLYGYQMTFCGTPVLSLGLGVDFTFALDNNDNDNNDNDNNDNDKDNNPHLNFLKGTVLGVKEQGFGIRDKR